MPVSYIRPASEPARNLAMIILSWPAEQRRSWEAALGGGLGRELVAEVRYAIKLIRYAAGVKE